MNVNTLTIHMLTFLGLEVVALLFFSFNDWAYATACGCLIMYLHLKVPEQK